MKGICFSCTAPRCVKGKKPNPDVLYEGHYRTVKKAECPQTRPAVVMDGTDAGKVLHVCRDEKCSVHARVSSYQPTQQERAARAKELLAERVEKESRLRILYAVRKKLPKTLSRPDLEMAALDYFERLGHDNHRRLCRVYGWEEKKSKASWGGSTVDYKAIARKAVPGMSVPEMQHFLVICSLVSDLYCPGFNPRESLAGDSNLAQTACRYKIDTAKLTSEVRAELIEKRKKNQKGRSAATTVKPRKRK
jgi:hypothetical protein